MIAGISNNYTQLVDNKQIIHNTFENICNLSTIDIETQKFCNHEERAEKFSDVK